MYCKSCGCTIAGASPEICPVCGKSTGMGGMGSSGLSSGVSGSQKWLLAGGLIALVAVVIFIFFK